MRNALNSIVNVTRSVLAEFGKATLPGVFIFASRRICQLSTKHKLVVRKTIDAHMKRCMRFVLMFAAFPVCGSAALAATGPGITEIVHLNVMSGPHAGKHELQGTRGACTYNLGQLPGTHGSWGNILSIDDPDPDKFTSLILTVPDTQAAKSGTDAFYLSAGFGVLGDNDAYKVDTRPHTRNKYGSGTVTVEDEGKTARVTFVFQSIEGVKVEGSIDCKKVARGR